MGNLLGKRQTPYRELMDDNVDIENGTSNRPEGDHSVNTESGDKQLEHFYLKWDFPDGSLTEVTLDNSLEMTDSDSVGVQGDAYLLCADSSHRLVLQYCPFSKTKGVNHDRPFSNSITYQLKENHSLPEQSYASREEAIKVFDALCKKNKVNIQKNSTDLGAASSAVGPSAELMLTVMAFKATIKAVFAQKEHTQFSDTEIEAMAGLSSFYWSLKWLQTSANLGVRSGISPRLLSYTGIIGFVATIIPFREIFTDFTALLSAKQEHMPEMSLALTLPPIALLALTRALKIGFADMGNALRIYGYGLRKHSPHWLRTWGNKLVILLVDRPMAVLMLATYLVAWYNIPMIRYYFEEASDLGLAQCGAMDHSKPVSLPNILPGGIVALWAALLFGGGEYNLLNMGHRQWLRQTVETYFPRLQESSSLKPYMLSLLDPTDLRGPVDYVVQKNTDAQLWALKRIKCLDQENPIWAQMRLHHTQKVIFRGGMFLGIAMQLFTLVVYGTLGLCEIPHDITTRLLAIVMLFFMFMMGCWNGYKEYQEPGLEMALQLSKKYPNSIGVFFDTPMGERLLIDYLDKKTRCHKTLSLEEKNCQQDFDNRTVNMIKAQKWLEEQKSQVNSKDLFQALDNQFQIDGHYLTKAQCDHIVYEKTALTENQYKALIEHYEAYSKIKDHLFESKIHLVAQLMPRKIQDLRIGLFSWFAPLDSNVPYNQQGDVDKELLMQMQDKESAQSSKRGQDQMQDKESAQSSERGQDMSMR